MRATRTVAAVALAGVLGAACAGLPAALAAETGGGAAGAGAAASAAGAAGAQAAADADAQAAADGASGANAQAADGEVAALAARGLTPNSHEGTVPVTAAAATVNGEELPVSVLVAFADATRAGIGSQTDAAWEAFLADQGFTVDEYWQYLLAHYATEMVLGQRCDELGIEVSDEEVDERIAQIRALLGIADATDAAAGDDAGDATGDAAGDDVEDAADAAAGTVSDADAIWGAYVQLYGSEEKLRADIAYNLRLIKLYELEVPRTAVSEEVVKAYADLYAATYEAYGLALAYDDAGAVDLDALDADARAQIEQDAADFAWSVACDAYVADLLGQADVQILVEHQYDVEGQSHGIAAA